jgi:FkbM family methyltransferase
MSLIKHRLYGFLKENFGILRRIKRKLILSDRTYELINSALVVRVDYDDAWLLALSRHSETAFDIGCNIGDSTILMFYGGVKEVLLIDAGAEALSVAAENLINNNLINKTRLFHAFVSQQDNENIKFFTVGTGAAGSIYEKHAVSASSINSFEMVSTTTVDSISRKINVIPELIKIDVEGAEWMVLAGAKTTASKQKSKILVEMHSNPDLTMEENARKVLDWCNECNYKAWYLKDKLELTSPEQIKNRGRCHLLLLPKQETFPEYLLTIEQSDSPFITR